MGRRFRGAGAPVLTKSASPVRHTPEPASAGSAEVVSPVVRHPRRAAHWSWRNVRRQESAGTARRLHRSLRRAPRQWGRRRSRRLPVSQRARHPWGDAFTLLTHRPSRRAHRQWDEAFAVLVHRWWRRACRRWGYAPAVLWRRSWRSALRRRGNAPTSARSGHAGCVPLAGRRPHGAVAPVVAEVASQRKQRPGVGARYPSCRADLACGTATATSSRRSSRRADRRLGGAPGFRATNAQRAYPDLLPARHVGTSYKSA